eukprot:gene3734-4083_t
MLEYDNSAFYYFALTMLSIYLLPGTWYAVSALFGSGGAATQARNKLEAKKASKIKNENSGWARLNTWTYKLNLIILVVAWIVFIYILLLVQSHGQVTVFDPFQILNIEHGAELKVIKKAYRALSLQYHPDKNIGNQAAADMFVKITKAYEALTDETAKENWEKFGNPDGKQALEVSIGLPTFLLENPKVVLVIYLIFMVIVIPGAVGWWYSNSQQYGEKNIHYSTYQAFYKLIKNNSTLRMLPEILATSYEYRTINASETINTNLLETLKPKMLKPKYDAPAVQRGNVLLHAHLLGLTDVSEKDRKDLHAMLKRSPELVEAMIELCQAQKFMTAALQCIQLSQCLAQGILLSTKSPATSSLLQLPYLSEADAQSLAQNDQVKSLSHLIELSAEERVKVLEKPLANLSKEDREDLLRTLDLFPRLSVETKLFVEEDDEEDRQPAAVTEGDSSAPVEEIRGDMIFEQDIVILRITFTRTNLPESASTVGPAYAPAFPVAVNENWWVIVTDHVPEGSRVLEPTVHVFEKISDNSRKVVHDVRFMAPAHEGDYSLVLRLLSDSYIGLDVEKKITFTVNPASKLPEYVPHADDLALDNEPTLFEQMMAANQDEEDSSDEEEEEEEEEQPKKGSRKASPPAADKKAEKGGKGKRVVVVDEDEDSD